MSNRTIVAVLTVLAAAGPAPAQQPPGRSAEDLAAARRLVGVWRLANRTVTFADGTSRPDPRTTAYLLYTDAGLACYIAMDPTRQPWKAETAPTPEEAVAGITGLGAYCGTFHVDAKEGSVVHRMEIERIPNLVGRARKRWFTFDSPDRLVLKVDPAEFQPPVVERRLIWERVAARPELLAQ